MRGKLTPRNVFQKIDHTATSAQSSAFNAKTSVIRVVCTTNAWVTFGTNPTAAKDSTSLFIAANVPEVFGVTAGQKMAVIRDASDGITSIAEGAV